MCWNLSLSDGWHLKMQSVLQRPNLGESTEPCGQVSFCWDRFRVLVSFYLFFTTVDICFVLSGLISTVRSFQKCNQNRTVLKFWYRIRYSRYIFNDFIFLIKTSNSDFSIPLLEGDLYSAFFGSFCIRICMRSTCPLFQVAVRKTNNKFE